MNDPQSTMARQIEVLKAIEPTVNEHLALLLPVEKAWQPTDYLPDFTAPDWRERLSAFRAPSAELSDDVLVVLVGDMVTEEALPNYAVSLNVIVQDNVGTSDAPWARWLRGWTSEENRHGDLLNAYLRLTGRVDMRSVEVTVHHLINNGFEAGAYPDLYAGLVYTAFQERATRISHANVGKLAQQQNNADLARICLKIAGDEARHESFYTRAMSAVLDADPEGGLITAATMLRKTIAMPGKLMFDGRDPDLFDHFAIVAQKLGVYTVLDYASIVRHLVTQWDIAKRSVTGKAARSQEFLCKHAERIEAHAEKAAEKLAASPKTPFSWIHNRLA